MSVLPMNDRPGQPAPPPEPEAEDAEPEDELTEGEALDDRTIHERMVAILDELPAIGKDSYNEQQKFHFRGVDDALNALNPLLARHGVFYVPEVLERVPGQRQTRQGNAMYEVNLHVRYRFFGLLGDYVDASGWGEGTDSGDKATAKAMTGAMKYVLFQVFAISTAEGSGSDADASHPEDTVPAGTKPPEAERPVATPTMMEALTTRYAALSERLGEAPAQWREDKWPPLRQLREMCEGQRPPLYADSVRDAHLILDAAEQSADLARALAEPCSICGSTRAERVVHDGVVRCARASACAKRAAGDHEHQDEDEAS